MASNSVIQKQYLFDVLAPIYPSPNSNHKQQPLRTKRKSPQRTLFGNFNSNRWKWPANSRKGDLEAITLVSLAYRWKWPTYSRRGDMKAMPLVSLVYRREWLANSRKGDLEAITLVSLMALMLAKANVTMSTLGLACMCKSSCRVRSETNVLPGMDQFRDFGTGSIREQIKHVQETNRLNVRQRLLGKASP